MSDPKRIIHLIDQIRTDDGKWFTRVWSVVEEEDENDGVGYDIRINP